jgi:type II secretory pathway pseudopilin PulG
MKNQRGMTLISWVIVLGIIAFFATIALRLIPMYQEYFGVKNIMQGMATELRDNKLTKQQVNIMLLRRFNTGYIFNVKKENIIIERGKNNAFVTKIKIDYEVREPFIAQIDLIGHFVSEIDVEPKGRTR